MRVDFYRVEMPSRGPSFGDLLRKVFALPDDESRTVDVEGASYRLQQLASDGVAMEGDIARIALDEAPWIGSRSGSERRIELADDEGVLSRTAFYYDESLQVLALQFARSGVLASTFARYFHHFISPSNPIYLARVPQPDTVGKLDRLDIVRKFRVRLAGITNPALITADARSPQDAVRLLSQSTAPTVDVVLSVGRGRNKSLNVLDVANSAKRLLGLARSREPEAEPVEISTIEIEGKYANGDAADLSLLQLVLVEHVTVEKVERDLLYADRKNGLRQAWERHRIALQRMFPPS